MNLIQALVNAIRLPELRNKILFTGGILIIFRLFANVAVPGAKQSALNTLFNQQALLGLLDLFSGGGLSRFSVVAMGMNPYINATIIMQLMTVISERIKEIQKEGETGRRRIQRWSRYLTVALGAGQAYGFTVLFQNTSPAILPVLDWFQRLEIVIVLTAGTVMLMWFGELITEYGIGNGVSLIIFAGIIGRGPQGVAAVFAAHTTGGGLADYIPFIVFGGIALVMTAVIIEVQQAVRKIPIQSAQRRATGHLVLQSGRLVARQLGSKHVQCGDGDHVQRALFPFHVRVHVLLHGHHIRGERRSREPQTLFKLHPRHTSGQTDGRLPRGRDESRHIRGRVLPWLHHRHPAHRDGEDLRHSPSADVSRRDRDPDRGRRGTGHNETAADAAGNAPVPRLYYMRTRPSPPCGEVRRGR